MTDESFNDVCICYSNYNIPCKACTTYDFIEREEDVDLEVDYYDEEE